MKTERRYENTRDGFENPTAGFHYILLLFDAPVCVDTIPYTRIHIIIIINILVLCMYILQTDSLSNRCVELEVNYIEKINSNNNQMFSTI